jgi:DNA-binding MarR family transcriptional regulator
MTKNTNPTAITAWARLVRAQRTALESVEADLKKSGYPPLVWYDVLLELERSKTGMLRHGALNAELLLPKHNLTRLIDRMEKQALVCRSACDTDKRGSHVCITQKGRKLRRNMWPTYETAIAQHFANRFSRDEIKILADFLGRV